MNLNAKRAKHVRAEFNRAVRRVLDTEAVGIEPITYHDGKRYILNSHAGKLFLYLEDEKKDQGELITAYMCFEDPQLAARTLPDDSRLNRFSGKWNFHVMGTWPPVKEQDGQGERTALDLIYRLKDIGAVTFPE